MSQGAAAVPAGRSLAAGRPASRPRPPGAAPAAGWISGLLIGALALTGCVTLPAQPASPVRNELPNGLPDGLPTGGPVTPGQPPTAAVVPPGAAPAAAPAAWRAVRLKRMDIAFERPADFLPDGRSGAQGGRRAWTHPQRAVVLGVVQYRRPGVDGAAETARFLTGLLPDAKPSATVTRHGSGIDFLTRTSQGTDGWVRVAFTQAQDENLLVYTVVARTGFPARDQANRVTAERFLASFRPFAAD